MSNIQPAFARGYGPVRQGMSKEREFDLQNGSVDYAVRITEPSRRARSDSDQNLGYWALDIEENCQ